MPLRWRTTKWVMVTTSLSGQDVGLEEIGTGIWRVFSGVNCLAILMRGRFEFKMNSDVLRETMCKRCIGLIVNDQVNCTAKQYDE